MECDTKSLYKTAFETSDNLYVLARGLPVRTPMIPRLPVVIIPTNAYMDRFLDDCEEFQRRAASFKGKREKAVKALVVKAAAAILILCAVKYFF